MSVHEAIATTPVRSTPAAGDREAASQQRIRIEQHSASGLLWLAGWLFSIGFLQLPFWKGVLALFIWPYYIGAAVAKLVV